MFFRQASQGAAPGEAYTRPPSLGPVGSSVPALVHAQPSAVAPSTPATEKLIEDHLSVQTIIRAYQVCFVLIRSLIKLHLRILIGLHRAWKLEVIFTNIGLHLC